MLIPYLGEKTKLSTFITPHIPTDIKNYIEPFGGVMGIFFSLNFMKFKDVKFIYNDFNSLNSNLFNQLKYNNDFIDQIKDIKVDKEFYSLTLKNLFNDKDEKQLAIDWLIVLTCSSMNKIGQDCWINDGEFEIFKLKFLAYKNLIDKIETIHNMDYKKIISMYDSETSFFYLDPPYTTPMKDKDTGYIGGDDFDYDRLSEVLKKIKGKFLMSLNNSQYIKQTFKNFKIKEVRIPINREPKFRKELLISNYDLHL